jgi:hypothetical protein
MAGLRTRPRAVDWPPELDCPKPPFERVLAKNARKSKATKKAKGQDAI